MSVKRGDIYYADLGYSFGSTIRGKRPVIVLQNDIANKYAPTVIVAPISSNFNNPKIPTQVKIEANQSGLKVDSVILLEQVRVIDKHKQLLDQKISSVDESFMVEVMDALKIAVAGDKFELSNDKTLNKKTLKSKDIKYDNSEKMYKSFYNLLENHTESIRNLEGKFDGSNSIKSKIKDWIFGGIIGALFSVILTLFL
ncbi:type II toxin-antitoxin system PemK/MazF family toxin [Clostridium sp. D2Q-11]|uniref:Type II toxin-antitoxin system PemK/MazF family toxin n=1 Tax=Anaeromonas frigoriresistens TaxID=2683708 RepID=A0A942UZZ4_9FIRM|nr:type II toxin-antitoxin system PemK/MazF family toxin [Anaeromonas frigoriresistens]